jgi:hypothetical protein
MFDPKTGNTTVSTGPYNTASRDMTRYESEQAKNSKLLDEVYQNIVALGDDFSKALRPAPPELVDGKPSDREGHAEAVQHLIDANERLEMILSRIARLRERYEL